MDKKRLVGKNWGMRNRSEGEREDTSAKRELSTKGTRVIHLGCQGNI